MARERKRARPSASDGGTEWTQVTQRHYDPRGDRELTTAIVYAIADARDLSPLEVTAPTLYDVLDVPALESAFFDGNRRENGGPVEGRAGTGSVEFRYDDLQVTVRYDGWISVSERRPTGRSDDD